MISSDKGKGRRFKWLCSLCKTIHSTSKSRKIKGNRSFVGVGLQKEPTTEGELLSGALPETEPILRLVMEGKILRDRDTSLSVYTSVYIVLFHLE